MRKLIITLSAVLILAMPLAAQDLETGYFLGGNPYAFRMNPSFQSERNIISIGLGMTGAGVQSNLGISTFLYPDASGNHLYTFLNDHVPASDVMRKLKRKNYIDADVFANLLTVGFWAERNFFTIDVNFRSHEAVSLPYDLFRFVKGGKAQGDVYECGRMGFQTINYAEAAIGWSRTFGDLFQVGVRSKFIMGALASSVRMDRLKVTVGEDHWGIESRGSLTVSSPAVRVNNQEGSANLDPQSFSIDTERIEPAGWGGAIDLGFSWNVIPLLTLSGAILDLGAVRWNREIQYATPESVYNWSPSSEEEENPAGEYGEEWLDLVQVAASFLCWEPVLGKGAAFELLPFRVHAGAEFRMPFYDRLSVGALYQGRFTGSFGRHTGRFSVNWNPFDMLSLSTSLALNRFGESMGLALNFHPAGINLVLGCDYIPFRCVDLSPLLGDEAQAYRSYARFPKGQVKMDVYLGLNIAFGRRRVDHGKRFLSK